MNLITRFEGTYISTKSTTNYDKDGRPVYNDYIALESNGDVGNVLCTSQVLKDLAGYPKYTKFEFTSSLDTWKKDFIVRSFKEL